jgi:DNA-binding response OmpR family regulator
VLVVDDDALIRLLLIATLSAEGWLVSEAASLAEGGAALRAAVPDVVVLDESLPDGSGLELVAQLRSGDEAVHVVLYSGTSVTPAPPGVDAVLLKGGPPDQLIEHLAAL